MGHHGIGIILLLALLALLLLPWPAAALVWGALGLLGVGLLRDLQWARRQPVLTGVEALRGAPAEVVAQYGPLWQVRCRSEVWSAISAGPLQVGETVRVAGMEGLKLVVVPEGTWPVDERAVDLVQAQRALEQLRADLARRVADLERRAEQQLQAAREALPGGEETARACLAARETLLESARRLRAQQELLESDLAALRR